MKKRAPLAVIAAAIRGLSYTDMMVFGCQLSEVLTTRRDAIGLRIDDEKDVAAALDVWASSFK